ncbi:MAG: hypothetical protein AAF939_21760 [Planctomycetota bacterium]
MDELRRISKELTYSFSCTGNERIKLPSYLIIECVDRKKTALLARIRKQRKSTKEGTALHIDSPTLIDVDLERLLTRFAPRGLFERDYTSRSKREDLWKGGSPWWLKGKFEKIQDFLVNSNKGKLDAEYFADSQHSENEEISLQCNDALNTAFRIFGMPRSLREEQIIDLDIESSFNSKADAFGGKRLFEHAGRRLYLEKVDRTIVEEILGVDLIYNFHDQGRVVFVQYKCHKTGNDKYYPSSDSNIESQIEKMLAIPGISVCNNLEEDEVEKMRLCRCPVFVKLCERDIKKDRLIPIGSYFPICIWQKLVNGQKSISVRDEPHLNNDVFLTQVKTGLIGSTLDQSKLIEEHLIQNAHDNRLKLVFTQQG